MANIIVSTPDELRAIVAEVISGNLQLQTKELPDTITLPTAIIFLNEYGFPTSKDKIYRLTSKSLMPHRKYGNKLVFSRKELLEWANSQSTRKGFHADTVPNKQRARRKN